MQQIQFIEVGLRKSTEQFCKKDGFYCVVKAVPNSSAKTIEVVSAYINKTGATANSVGDHSTSELFPGTSENASASATPIDTISQNAVGVKGNAESAAGLGEDTNYVVEAVPNRSVKTIKIISAYISKTGAQTPVGGNPQNGPVPVTSKNATSVTPAKTISQNATGVKGDTESAADFGENTKSAESGDDGRSAADAGSRSRARGI